MKTKNDVKREKHNKKFIRSLWKDSKKGEYIPLEKILARKL